MNDKNDHKYTFVGTVLKFWNTDYIYQYTIDKGYSRFEFVRSAIYSITTSLIIIFLSRLDTLHIASWVFLLISVILAISAASKFTFISLTLKDQTESYYRRGIDKISKKKEKTVRRDGSKDEGNDSSITLKDFIKNGTDDTKGAIARSFRLGFVFCAIIVLVESGSFLLNRMLKEQYDFTTIELKLANIQRVDSLKVSEVISTNRKIDSIQLQIAQLNKLVTVLKLELDTCK